MSQVESVVTTGVGGGEALLVVDSSVVAVPTSGVRVVKPSASRCRRAKPSVQAPSSGGPGEPSVGTAEGLRPVRQSPRPRCVLRIRQRAATSLTEKTSACGSTEATECAKVVEVVHVPVVEQSATARPSALRDSKSEVSAGQLAEGLACSRNSCQTLFEACPTEQVGTVSQGDANICDSAMTQEGVGELQCSCGLTFKGARWLVKHLNVRPKKGAAQCDRAAETRKYELLSCSNCPFICGSLKTMKLHASKQQGVAGHPVPHFDCPGCDANFDSAIGLSNHKRVCDKYATFTQGPSGLDMSTVGSPGGLSHVSLEPDNDPGRSPPAP